MGRKEDKLKNKKRRKRRLHFLKKFFEITVFLLVVLVITYFLNEYVVERTAVHNHSMEPTLFSGDVLLTDKLTYRNRDPKRYEIILFINENDGEELVKRVIGLPGETVRLAAGKIFINGDAIDDIEGLEGPFDAGDAETDFELEDDEYFVLGDNRKDSIDSRDSAVGAVKRDTIIGKTLIRIKPLNKIIIK